MPRVLDQLPVISAFVFHLPFHTCQRNLFFYSFVVVHFAVHLMNL